MTSTIKCWEKNYIHSSYIAELFNIISNAHVIILALIGLISALRQRFEKRFIILHLSNMALAIGSMSYHATLQRVLQSSDKMPMVWEMVLYIYILYSPDWHYKSTMSSFLFLYGARFAVVHALVHFGIDFKLYYVLLCLLCIPRMYKYYIYIYIKDVDAKRLAKLYLVTLTLGSVCRIFDSAFCQNFNSWGFNPQAHAFWDVLVGFQFLFCKHLLDVFPSTSTWMESASLPPYGYSSLFEDPKAKDPVRK